MSTYIKRENSKLIFGTNSNDRATIDSNGKVGIGITIPNYELDVSGTVQQKNIISSVIYLTENYGDSVTVNEIYNNLWSISGSDLYYNDGNIGIGTNSPQGNLHISSGTSGDCVLILEADTDNNDENDNPKIIFRQDGGQDEAGIYMVNNQLNISDGIDDIVFRAGGGVDYDLATERMRIDSNGNVGIGESNPPSALSVVGNIFQTKATNNYNYGWRWRLSGSGIDPENYYIDLILNGATNNKGFFEDDAGSVSAIDFTGQHRSVPLNNQLFNKKNIGLIVSSTGQYNNLTMGNEPTINEALPIVNLTENDNDKKVFGVISDEEQNDNERQYKTGTFVSVFQKDNIKIKKDKRFIINSLGEGGIWVCNKNGNIENGDYITSCDVKGYGMKQNDDLLHNYTVAKITQDCDFDIMTDKDRYLDTNGKIITKKKYEKKKDTMTLYKAKFVGCTYHCG